MSPPIAQRTEYAGTSGLKNFAGWFTLSIDSVTKKDRANIETHRVFSIPGSASITAAQVSIGRHLSHPLSISPLQGLCKGGPFPFCVRLRCNDKSVVIRHKTLDGLSLHSGYQRDCAPAISLRNSLSNDRRDRHNHCDSNAYSDSWRRFLPHVSSVIGFW